MIPPATLLRLFDRFVDDVPSFFGIFDWQTRQPFNLNRAGLTMLGLHSVGEYPRRYPDGFSPDLLAAPDFADRFGPLLSEGPWRGRVECRRHTGERFWVWMSLMAETVGDRAYLLVRATDVLFLQHLSQQALPTDAQHLSDLARQRTAALLDTLRELDESKHALAASLAREHTFGARKSEFIRAVSHEFRTPLAIIQTAVALLPRLNAYPEKQRQHGEAIQAQIQHLTTLLDALVQQTLHDDEPLTGEDIHQKAQDLKLTAS